MQDAVPAKYTDTSVVVTGTKKTTTIEQIIAKHGARVPAFADSAKNISLAFAVYSQQPLSDAEMSWLDLQADFFGRKTLPGSIFLRGIRRPRHGSNRLAHARRKVKRWLLPSSPRCPRAMLRAFQGSSRAQTGVYGRSTAGWSLLLPARTRSRFARHRHHAAVPQRLAARGAALLRRTDPCEKGRDRWSDDGRASSTGRSRPRGRSRARLLVSTPEERVAVPAKGRVRACRSTSDRTTSKKRRVRRSSRWGARRKKAPKAASPTSSRSARTVSSVLSLSTQLGLGASPPSLRRRRRNTSTSSTRWERSVRS